MNVGVRRILRASAIGLVVIAVSYPLANYFGLFNGPAAPSGSEWQRKYWDAVSKADTAGYLEDWSEAARQYEKINALLPFSPAARYSRAISLAHLGRSDESLAELRLAVKFGWADVAALRSNPAFAEFRKTSGFEALLKQAAVITKESIVVHVPPDHDQRLPALLIIAFHGQGGNPHSYIQTWKHAAEEIGAVLVASRGNRPVGSAGGAYSFRWRIAKDDEALRRLSPFKKKVEQSIELAKRSANIDENRILLAGYSQGGAVALALLADAPEQFCGAVLESPSYHAGMLEKWTKLQSDKTVRVCVLVHEFDKMRPEGEEAYRALTEAGVVAQLRVVTGADHEIPLDNSARLVNGVRFVLEPAPAAP